MKLDIVFFVTMATMYALMGSVRAVETLLKCTEWPGPIWVWAVIVMLVMVVCDSRFIGVTLGVWVAIMLTEGEQELQFTLYMLL